VADVEASEPRSVPVTPDPTHRLPRAARGYFVVQALGWAVPLTIASLVVGDQLAGSEDVADWIAVVVMALGPLVGLVGAIPMPLVRWSRWRYELRDEEIDLLRGAWIVRRTLIPMVRVQHVDTRRTWLADQLGVQAVVVHTAAGSHEIPALTPSEAASIRDRIALLARQPDEP
jgi:membrane protein YdbS with pleckstrin-like domain